MDILDRSNQFGVSLLVAFILLHIVFQVIALSNSRELQRREERNLISHLSVFFEDLHLWRLRVSICLKPLFSLSFLYILYNIFLLNTHEKFSKDLFFCASAILNSQWLYFGMLHRCSLEWKKAWCYIKCIRVGALVAWAQYLPNLHSISVLTGIEPSGRTLLQLYVWVKVQYMAPTFHWALL